MKVIEYVKLYNYLVEVEDLERPQVLRNILRIRRLPKDLLKAVLIIITHPEAYPDIKVEGVSFEELVDKDGMKKIRAILMLDWIRREPEAALSYMAENTMKAPIQPLNVEEKEELDAAIERLKKQVKEVPQPEPEIDKSEEDIVIEDSLDNTKETPQSESEIDNANAGICIERTADNVKETPLQEIDKSEEDIVQDGSAEKVTGTPTDKQEV